jgi:hypothetical protein
MNGRLSVPLTFFKEDNLVDELYLGGFDINENHIIMSKRYSYILDISNSICGSKQFLSYSKSCSMLAKSPSNYFYFLSSYL